MVRKIFKTIIFIIISFACTNTFEGHARGSKVFVSVDSRIVNRYKDSLLLDKTSEVIIFQTTMLFDHIKSSDGLLTFIIWRQNNNCLTVIVSDSKIYSVTPFSGQDIFNYGNKHITYVTQDEKTLKFTPPIFGNAVYFFSKTASNYFEFTGTNSQPWTYVPRSKKKEDMRKEYFSLIYSTLKKEKLNLRALRNYKRHT
ncbi:hypothetical protein [Hymenobacter saemangeumensis]|uniref:hypothetical protein n=1 Tax=Hymenobacter saemangeumensis TaxID=1084522 RepID=UPI0031E61622